MKNELGSLLMVAVAILHAIWSHWRSANARNIPTARTRLNIGDLRFVTAPTSNHITEAIFRLSEVNGPGFLILERPGGDYMQCAPSGKDSFVLEARLYEGERYRHYAAQVREVSARSRKASPASAQRPNLDPAAEDVLSAMTNFRSFGRLARALRWVDITDEYQGKRRRA